MCSWAADAFMPKDVSFGKTLSPPLIEKNKFIINEK
jgi:hypothetical protein